MLFVIDSRYKPDYRKYVAEIEQLRSRLAPLTAYPDVRNYYNEEFKLNNFVGGLVDNKVYTDIGEIIEEIGKL